MIRPHFLLLLVVLLVCWKDVQSGSPDFNTNLWKSPIPIAFDDGYTGEEKNIVRGLIQTITDNTCIDFKENLPGPHLVFFLETDSSNNCRADVGSGSSNKYIYLSRGCLTVNFTILHETYHALGFWHEHQRPDRDDYITLDMENIQEDMKGAYEKKPKFPTDYGIPYEFGSLLHYPTNISNTQIIPSESGITPTYNYSDYAATIDSKHGMVYNDWKVINLHYNCSDKCSVKTTCENGGYQNSRNCSECVCPRFYEGSNCQIERNPHTLVAGEVFPLDFGWHFNVSTYLGIASRFSEFDPRPMPDLTNLERSPAWIIKAPKGKLIRVTINDMFDVELGSIPYPCLFGCTDKALEIVDGDLTRVGKRFCCNSKLPISFVSETNVIGYHVYAVTGLDFVVNATFHIEGTATVTPLPPISRPTTPSSTQMCETVPETTEDPHDTLSLLGTKSLHYCGQKGNCIIYRPGNSSYLIQRKVNCACRRISYTGWTWKCPTNELETTPHAVTEKITDRPQPITTTSAPVPQTDPLVTMPEEPTTIQHTTDEAQTIKPESPEATTEDPRGIPYRMGHFLCFCSPTGTDCKRDDAAAAANSTLPSAKNVHCSCTGPEKKCKLEQNN